MEINFFGSQPELIFIQDTLYIIHTLLVMMGYSHLTVTGPKGPPLPVLGAHLANHLFPMPVGMVTNKICIDCTNTLCAMCIHTCTYTTT